MPQNDSLEIRSVLKELYNISGFRISVHDMRFREIQAYPNEVSPYCHLVQQSENGLCRCRENDRRAFEHVGANPEVYLYKCCFGLYEAVAPLYIMDNIVGYLMMGQLIDDLPGSKEAIIKKAADYVDDRQSLTAAGDAVAVCDNRKFCHV